MKLHLFNQTYDLAFVLGQYANGALAVRLVDKATGEPFATLSLNVPDESNHLPVGAFFLKDYSENEELAHQLIVRRDIVPLRPVRLSTSGFHAYRINNNP